MIVQEFEMSFSASSGIFVSKRWVFPEYRRKAGFIVLSSDSETMMTVQPYFGFEGAVTFRTSLRGWRTVRFVLRKESCHIDLRIADILLVGIIAHESHSLDREIVVQQVCYRLGIRGFRNVKEINYGSIRPSFA